VNAQIIRLDDYRSPNARAATPTVRFCPECRKAPAARGWCAGCTADIERRINDHRRRARRKIEGHGEGLCACCLEPIAPREVVAIDQDTGEVFHAFCAPDQLA